MVVVQPVSRSDAEGDTVVTGTAATETDPTSTLTIVTQFSKTATDTLTNTIEVE